MEKKIAALDFTETNRFDRIRRNRRNQLIRSLQRLVSQSDGPSKDVGGTAW
jgi:hypothetical protein